MNSWFRKGTLAKQLGRTALGIIANVSILPAAVAEMRPGVPEIAPGVSVGYLAKEERLDSVSLVPPPPERDSAADQVNQQLRAKAKLLHGTPRWQLAIKDASLSPDDAVGAFSCASGIDISPTTTPRLFQLLQRVMVDTGLSTDGAKKRYQTLRPFVVNGEAMCTPNDDTMLRADGSYPSGHAALGWGAALVLSQIIPDRANEIIARGRAFGESRIICNVHWQSDIIAGRFMGSATVAILGGKPDYLADVETARKEVQSARTNGTLPRRDCTAEAAALEMKLPGAH